MGMRLIDADALCEVIEGHVTTVSVCPSVDWAMGKSQFKKMCLEDIKNASTIDAEPVRHGRWLRLDEAPEWDQRRCSECGDISCCQRNYCPNCGARMDGDGDATD